MSKKIAFVYPGQGVQKVGMGQDFYEQFPEAKAEIDLAAKVTGIDLTKLLFEENDDINKTEFTQLALVATCSAMTNVIRNKGIEASMAGGLSLGEYAALRANGALEAEDVYKLIRMRGKFMQESSPDVEGGMSAIVGLDLATIEEVCNGIECVQPANLNCPGQVVISGEKAAVTKAGEILAEKGARKVVALNVSGAFHSHLMKDAAVNLAKELESVNFNDMKFPYCANANAQIITDKNQIKDLLIKQVDSPVRWEESVRNMIADGVDLFVEIGPGKTIAGFLKKIDPTAVCINISTVEDLAKLDGINE